MTDSDLVQAVAKIYNTYGSYDLVKEKFDLSTQMINKYVRLARLPPELKHAIKEGKIHSNPKKAENAVLKAVEAFNYVTGGSIPVDRVIELAKYLAKPDIGLSDDVKIKKWVGENPDLSMNECIENARQLKPVEETTHMVVIEIQDELRAFMEANIDYEEKILGMLRENLPGTFYAVNAGNSVAAISMDEEAYKIFYREQYEKNSSYTIFLNNFLAEWVR
ncbi:hypothetical protein CENSYa_0140 [Cenarchaeum symbiosum A]|uniref:Uncharacterized protein n=1 Tax=Cenarchaeum symbiosum (strain A) TaxID=414004 RepID=A0RTW8_CENSY|nr:hypothetical protein CENSYa_0140 [Cenarchaeum symbiosum A]